MQCTKVNFNQHGDDHDPNQQADGDVHWGDFDVAQALKNGGELLTQCDANDNAQGHPQGKVTFK